MLRPADGSVSPGNLDERSEEERRSGLDRYSKVSDMLKQVRVIDVQFLAQCDGDILQVGVLTQLIQKLRVFLPEIGFFHRLFAIAEDPVLHEFTPCRNDERCYYIRPYVRCGFPLSGIVGIFLSRLAPMGQRMDQNGAETNPNMDQQHMLSYIAIRPREAVENLQKTGETAGYDLRLTADS